MYYYNTSLAQICTVSEALIFRCAVPTKNRSPLSYTTVPNIIVKNNIMALPPLPLEIVSKILLYIPLSYLKYFHERLPKGDSLKSIIQGEIYGKLVYVAGNHSDSLEEREDTEAHLVPKYSDVIDDHYVACALARRILKAHVVQMKIIIRTHRTLQTFLDFCNQYPEFISEIPSICVVGEAQSLRLLTNVIYWENITHLELIQGEEFTMILCPPHLEKFSIVFLDQPTQIMKGWPKTLKSIKIQDARCAKSILLPDSLQELICHDSMELWTTYPSSIRLLDLSHSISDVSCIHIPSQVRDLSLQFCDLKDEDLRQIRFPPQLKRLDLKYNSIRSLADVLFPSSLIMIDVQGCLINRLDDVCLPDGLQELYVGSNQLKSLDNVIFPQLKLLDISAKNKDHNIFNFSKARFPSSLESLLADGHKTKDWSKVTLPICLKRWTFSTVEDSRYLLFPSNLEVLFIEFPESSQSKFCDLKLPSTLQEISLHHGVSSDFHWNLPLLSTMSIKDCKGPIQFPSSLIELNIQGLCDQMFRNVQLPCGLRKLTSTYPFAKYPESLTDLEVHLPGNKYSEIPRGLRRVQHPPQFRPSLEQKFPGIPILDATSSDLNEYFNTAEIDWS